MSAVIGRLAVPAAVTWLAGILIWLVAFLFAFTTVLHNDHFDRIVHARQIARYGELPFRDFLDPGYFMTGFASAGLQWLLGDRLLGDLLLDATFIATGTLVVLLLARRISRSLLAGCATALLALFAAPRLYDFDKVLFYPLGVLLCWRYAERPAPANLVLLAAGAVLGASFRYDSGLYIGAAAVVTLAAVHWRDAATTLRRLGMLAAAIAIVALPFLLFIQLTAGLAAAADQIVTYAIREGLRTRITSPPGFSFAAPVDVPVRVRWTPDVGHERRRELAEQYGLREEGAAGAPEDRTWAYRMADASSENVRRLISDPRVEDTHGIDRSSAAGSVEPAWTPSSLTDRWLGFPLLPRLWTPGNALAFVYHALWALPLLGVLALVPRSARPPRVQTARVLSLAAMALCLDVFILREPVSARLGGMAGPALVMGAWLASRAWRAGRMRVPGRALLVVLAIPAIWSISQVADWRTELRRERMSWDTVDAQFRAVATGAGQTQPHGPWFGIITYVRECTRPQDRVYASWFIPELYFYAQRGFAAGMSVTFGGHWSEPRYQQRMIDWLRAQETPVVLIQAAADDDFQRLYPSFYEYLRERYRPAGETGFGDPNADPGAYRVLVDRNRVPSGVHPASSMPCFR